MDSREKLRVNVNRPLARSNNGMEFVVCHKLLCRARDRQQKLRRIRTARGITKQGAQCVCLDSHLSIQHRSLQPDRNSLKCPHCCYEQFASYSPTRFFSASGSALCGRSVTVCDKLYINLIPLLCFSIIVN